MIQCEWNDVKVVLSIKQCSKDAKYIIKFKRGQPIVLPFHDCNFVCEEHLKLLHKRKFKMEVYEFVEYNEKVQFT
jgi:hypothetical protein